MSRAGIRGDIQGLRALAVMLVIFDHLGLPGLRGGYTGVDVFFVVSGFLITGLLLRERRTKGRISIPQFYARRARRILPAASVVLVAISLYAAWTTSLNRVREVTDDVTWSAFFAANWHFAAIGTNYFQQGRAPSPVQHFWSLAVEEQFYIVWPALLSVLLIARIRHLVRLSLVAAVWAASLSWAVVLLDSSATSAYFSSPCRAWELATGALLAMLLERPPHLSGPMRWGLGLGGLAAIGTGAAAFDATTRVPGLPALIPALGTVAVIAAGAGSPDRGIARLLGLRPLALVGDASYSLYLWHWPVLVFGATRLDLPPFQEGAVLLVVTVLLAAISYVVVEQPFRRGRLRLVRGRRALGLWPAALAMVLGSSALATSHVSAELGRSREAARLFYAAHPQAPADPARVVTGSVVHEELLSGVQAGRRHDPIPPEHADADLLAQRWEPRFCHAGFYVDRAPPCAIGDRASEVKIVALGDSHMGQWLEALDRDGKARHYQVIPLVKFGCPAYDVAMRWGRDSYTSCESFRDWTTRRIRDLRPSAVVVGDIIAYDRMAVGSRSEAVTALEAGVRSMVQRLQTLTPTVILLSDLAERDDEPSDCLSNPHNDLGSCLWTQRGDAVDGNPRLQRIAGELGARFVSVTSLVCADGTCPLVAARRVTYADHGHVSLSWSGHVSAALGRRLALAPQAVPSTVADDLRAALALADTGAPIPAELVNLDGLDRDGWEDRYCHAAGAHADHRICPLGDVTSSFVVVTYGDSHLGQWLPALDRIGRRAGVRVLPFTKGGCPPYDVRVVSGPDELTSCPPWRAWAERQIEALEPDLIIVGSRTDLARVIAPPGASAAAEFDRGVTHLVETWRSLAPVVVISDIPEPGFDPGDCLTGHHAVLSTCAFQAAGPVIEANERLQRVAETAGGRFVDVVPLVCVTGRCPMVVDGLVVFADWGHVSMTWARSVAAELGDRLQITAVGRERADQLAASSQD